MDEGFNNIAAVLEHLKAEGWAVTKTTLYRHRSEGKILPQGDGAFRLKDVEKYAKAWLRERSTGKRVSERIDEQQRRKLDLELANLEIDKKRKQFNFDRDQERYILREQVELEHAARAAVFEAGLKHLIQSRAADWIRAVEGDMKKIGELINLMNRDMDEHINHYASPAEYEVVFEAEEEAADEAPEIEMDNLTSND